MTSELWAEPSQILGFVAGAAVVAVLDPHKTLGIDDVTFGLSAVILLTGVRSRPAPGRAGAARASLWSVSADGVRIVFGSRLLLTLLQFGWLAGFYIVPEGLAAPYARSLHGNALTVGLLMAWAVLVLWTLAGAGGAYQLAAAAAFVQELRPDTRTRAFGVGLAGLAGLVGLTAATMLAMSWTHLRGRLVQATERAGEP